MFTALVVVPPAFSEPDAETTVAADLREIRGPADFGCGAPLSVFGGGL